jgi:N-acetylglutamate synthase-like GNAT family acetyltransferase
MGRKPKAVRVWDPENDVPLAVVREAGEHDVPNLLDLYAQCKHIPLLPGYPPVLEANRRDWLSSALHRGFSFVAEETGRLVAHLAMIRIGDAAEMFVYVHPDVSRRGIGSALMRVAVDQARDMGLRHLFLTLRPQETLLQQTALQAGFHVASRTAGKTDMALTL